MSSTQSAISLFGSIDDYLGPSARRFFGSGYRRVNYTVSNVTLTERETGPAGMTAVIGIRYPVDWSSKATGDLRPHLSTIDVLILAVRAAEFLTSRAHGHDARQRTGTWVRRVDIKAPSAPVEDHLDEVVVTAKPLRGAPDEDGLVASTFDCRIATMRARVELMHEPGTPRPGGDPHTAFGAGYPGLYGTGFQQQWQAVRDVMLDVRAQRAEGVVTVGSPTGHPALRGGPESADGPVVSLVDAFAVALQLGQVLLYETDRTTRGRSNTLWMRHTTITAGAPPTRRAEASFPTFATLEDSSLLRTGDHIWRAATVVGDSLGVRTRCAVTHRLPARP